MRPRPRRTLAVAVGCVVGALALSGCFGGEEPLLDDGTQAIPLAGLEGQLDDAGIDVVSADAPVAATGDDVVAALEVQLVEGPEATRTGDVADGFVAFDPAEAAGLLSVVGDDAGTVVVLVFDRPASAAVFAASDPDVFTDETLEKRRQSALAGNVVAYTAPPDDDAALAARVGTALDDLESPVDPPTGG